MVSPFSYRPLLPSSQASLLLLHKRSSGELPTPYYLYYMTRNRLHFARRHFDGGSDAVLEEFTQSFLRPWRDRVQRLAPDWVVTFDQLVAQAVDDARSGVTGRREAVDTIEAPRPAAASTA